MNNRFNREFTVNPGFVNATAFEPRLCIQACSVLGASYAAIESGKFCFCKMGSQIISSIGQDTNCKVYNCFGQPGFYCGSDTHLLVYYAGAIVTVSL